MGRKRPDKNGIQDGEHSYTNQDTSDFMIRNKTAQEDSHKKFSQEVHNDGKGNISIHGKQAEKPVMYSQVKKPEIKRTVASDGTVNISIHGEPKENFVAKSQEHQKPEINRTVASDGSINISIHGEAKEVHSAKSQEHKKPEINRTVANDGSVKISIHGEERDVHTQRHLAVDTHEKTNVKLTEDQKVWSKCADSVAYNPLRAWVKQVNDVHSRPAEDIVKMAEISRKLSDEERFVVYQACGQEAKFFSNDQVLAQKIEGLASRSISTKRRLPEGKDEHSADETGDPGLSLRNTTTDDRSRRNVDPTYDISNKDADPTRTARRDNAKDPTNTRSIDDTRERS